MDELMATIFVWILPVLLVCFIISIIKRNGWFGRISIILYLLFVTTGMFFVFSNPVEWYHEVYIISFVSLFYFWCVFTYYMVKDKSKKIPVVFSIISGALMIVSSYFNPEPGMLSETISMVVAFFILFPIASIIFSIIITMVTGNVRSSKLVDKARGTDKKVFSEYKLPTYSVGVSVPIIHGMKEYRLVGDSSMLGDLFMRFLVIDEDGRQVHNKELIGKVAEPISEILLFKALQQPVNRMKNGLSNPQNREAEAADVSTIDLTNLNEGIIERVKSIRLHYVQLSQSRERLIELLSLLEREVSNIEKDGVVNEKNKKKFDTLFPEFLELCLQRIYFFKKYESDIKSINEEDPLSLGPLRKCFSDLPWDHTLYKMALSKCHITITKNQNHTLETIMRTYIQKASIVHQRESFSEVFVSPKERRAFPLSLVGSGIYFLVVLPLMIWLMVNVGGITILGITVIFLGAPLACVVPLSSFQYIHRLMWERLEPILVGDDHIEKPLFRCHVRNHTLKQFVWYIFFLFLIGFGFYWFLNGGVDLDMLIHIFIPLFISIFAIGYIWPRMKLNIRRFSIYEEFIEIQTDLLSVKQMKGIVFEPRKQHVDFQVNHTRDLDRSLRFLSQQDFEDAKKLLESWASEHQIPTKDQG
ncbi:hypothetical protein ACERII_18050 [Evansella sp. AB-rgal1]|uniref:hypothetical protein n=1 Tax=Evansella sp. AB-rgal1 TaxID=3242696 RepID=UPI00359CBCA6